MYFHSLLSGPTEQSSPIFLERQNCTAMKKFWEYCLMVNWEIKTRKLITRMKGCVTERMPEKKERETEGRKKRKKQRPNKMIKPRLYSSVFIHETIIRLVIWLKM
jgi:hypothetical protein